MIYEKKIDDTTITSNLIKAQSFFDLKLEVHILKSNREWLNGSIKEVGKSYLILIERKKGEVVVFFHEMFSIEKLEERK